MRANSDRALNNPASKNWERPPPASVGRLTICYYHHHHRWSVRLQQRMNTHTHRKTNKNSVSWIGITKKKKRKYLSCHSERNKDYYILTTAASVDINVQKHLYIRMQKYIYRLYMYSKTSRTKHENLISTHTCCNEIIFPYFSSSLFLSLSLPLSPFNSGSALILLFFFFVALACSLLCARLCACCAPIL